MKLPPEVMQLIAQELNSASQFALLRVCRRWNAIFFRFVYSDLELHTRDIKPLLHAIRHKKEIGPAVRRLKLPKSDNSVCDLKSDGEDLAWARDRVNRFSGTEEEAKEWYLSLKQLESDAWAALLIAHLDNLFELSVHEEGGSLHHINNILSCAATRKPPFDEKPLFQKLERIELTTGDLSLETRQAFPMFLSLPALRSVFVRGSLGEPHGVSDEIPPCSSGVEDIKLEYRWRPGSDVPAYIRSCKNLKRFSFTSLDEWNDDMSRDRDLREEFYEPLLSHKETLEMLELNYRGLARDDKYSRHSDEPYDRWLGSFAGFKRLKDLSLRSQNILDVAFSADHGRHRRSELADVLPESLVSFSISYTCPAGMDDILEAMDALLSTRRKLPNLKKITIACQTQRPLVEYEPNQQDRLDRLVDGFESVGILLTCTVVNKDNVFSWYEDSVSDSPVALEEAEQQQFEEYLEEQLGLG
ncbi:hypothetical protein BDV18DRAFT_161382 [Aspergillus unguis]